MRVQSQGENCLWDSLGFQPKLITYVQNVALLGEPPKTTLQEELLSLIVLQNPEVPRRVHSF
jgi:hypothetical protein